MSKTPEKPLELWLLKSSPPCRGVWFALKHLDLNFIIREMKPGENMKAEYSKMNPLHTIPSIVDDGFVVTDSRAIMLYLVDAHCGGDHPLYPRDLRQRATINSRLFLDGTAISREIREYLRPQLFQKEAADPKKERAMLESLKPLENALGSSSYSSGESLSIADLALVSSVTYLELLEYDLGESCPLVKKYVARAKEQMPYFEECSQGLAAWKKVLLAQKAKNAAQAERVKADELKAEAERLKAELKEKEEEREMEREKDRKAKELADKEKEVRARLEDEWEELQREGRMEHMEELEEEKRQRDEEIARLLKEEEEYLKSQEKS